MKLERAARQALETLETLDCGDSYKTHNAATALREALAEQAEQEPVGVVEGSGEWGIAGVLAAGIPIGTKLYAAPVRVQDLTDDEVYDVCKDIPFVVIGPDYDLAIARAVIAADRELNKC